MERHRNLRKRKEDAVNIFSCFSALDKSINILILNI